MLDAVSQKVRWPLTVDGILKLLPGVSRRKLLQIAKELGCASKIGNQYFFEEDDLRKLLQETKLCPSKSSGEKGLRRSMALTAKAEYEKALALATQKKRNGSSFKSSPDSTGPKSSENPASPPSLRLVTLYVEQGGDTTYLKPILEALECAF